MNNLPRLLIVLVCLVALAPKTAYGLAGLAEFSSEYYYTPKIIIDYGHPSDMCSSNYGNQKCFVVRYVDDPFRSDGFGNLDPLTQVNFPQISVPKHVIGKSYEDGNWLLYDVDNDLVVMRENDYEKLLPMWDILGYKKPVLISTSSFYDYFEKETEKSQERNREHYLFILPILIAPFVTLAFYIALFVIIYKSLNKASKRQ